MKNKKSTLIISVALLVGSFNQGFAQRIAAGPSHSLARCYDGTARAWGYNVSGQLGDSSTGTNRSFPVRVATISSVTALAAGGYFSMALLTGGSVWTWGENLSYEIGDSTTTSRFSPVQVHGNGNVGFLNGITAIAAGKYVEHALALKSDSTVWAWGGNNYGQLGDSTNVLKKTPVQVHGSGNIGFLTGIISVACGDGYSIALKRDSTVWAWGNGYGWNPVRINGLSAITAISAGIGHSLAIKNDGTVWAWGLNTYGQLGDSTNIDRSTPIKVKGLTGIIGIAVGGKHSLAVKNDGTVWAFGWNNYGELGDGTNVDKWAPVQVSGITGVTEVKAGLSHSLALKNDGTVWAWGWNYFGQLGDSTTIDRWAPVQVKGLCTMTYTGINETPNSLNNII
ncbi:MAG: RCC1 domain-containing protein, partial [Bacteroidia bacterium]